MKLFKPALRLIKVGCFLFLAFILWFALFCVFGALFGHLVDMVCGKQIINFFRDFGITLPELWICGMILGFGIGFFRFIR